MRAILIREGRTRLYDIPLRAFRPTLALTRWAGERTRSDTTSAQRGRWIHDYYRLRSHDGSGPPIYDYVTTRDLVSVERRYQGISAVPSVPGLWE